MPVVHIRKTNANFIYIGRYNSNYGYGYFGNPCVIGRTCIVCQEVHRVPGSTLECFEYWAREKIAADPRYRKAVSELHQQTLGCWCAPGPCHGDILLKLAAELQQPPIKKSQ